MRWQYVSNIFLLPGIIYNCVQSVTWHKVKLVLKFVDSYDRREGVEK